ncbi:MAG: hypothetical protein M4D80_25315 [Myxococcota bacterium]|nr:hypothetical protein [Deltaproteobacteria bacterium]MDQ3338499.1 hypothetical protein [Myxococcota bacterium]
MLKLSVLAGFLVVTGSVHAGYKGTPGAGAVSVYRYTDGTGFVRGTLSDTRASADTTSYLDCIHIAYPGNRYAYCSAYDASLTFGWCWTSDPAILAVIASIEPDTGISFEWNANGMCAYVQATTTSVTAPKQP